MRADGAPLRAGSVAEACHGIVLCGDPEAEFAGISTDSREIRENDLFVPLQGPNFDGHDFLLPALEAGARGSLVNRDTHREIPIQLTSRVLIQVQDTLQALSNLASARRIQYPIPLIAVTGSSGKTTVKEMIAAILRESHRPLVSQANFNNLIGLPMTVLNMSSQHDIAVVEAGINLLGEMDELARAAAPDVAVITTIGPVHLEGLGSIEVVAREKFKLITALRPTGTAVLPADNPLLQPLLGECPGRVVTFGVDKGDFHASRVALGDEPAFEMVTPFGTQKIHLRSPGRHSIANSLAAAAACTAVGVSLQEVANALEKFVPPNWRMEVIGLPGERKLIRDCYNANPQSVKAALEVLSGMGNGAKLAILGDMMELGERSEALHREIGTEAALLKIDRVFFVGKSGPAVREGFVSAGGKERSVTLTADKEAAWKEIAAELQGYDVILVKGSRLMRMEILAERIVKEN